MNTANPRDFLKRHGRARAGGATAPAATISTFPQTRPLRLDCGKLLAPYRIAYKTYGTLNAAKSNAILVAHALTGDQYVASPHPVTGKPGWWETMVGPGKPIDTDRFFVICPNVLGGCMGSTGPGQHQPDDRQALGPRLSRHHHRRHGGRAGAADRPPRHRPAVLRHRRLHGRHAGAASGRRATRSACSPPCRSPPRPGTPRRTSPSTRWAGRR